ITGELDEALFEEALQRVVRRHEALRTVFLEGEDGPRQMVLKEAAVRLAVEDVRELSEEERHAYVQEQIRQSEQVPFDLGQGPLMRAKLYRLDEQTFRLYACLHHIVTDGWSIQRLQREWMDTYGKLLHSDAVDGEAPKLRYVDYAEWQTRELEEGRWSEEEAYWLETLAKPLPNLELPMDYARPETQTYAGDTVKLEIPRESAKRLKELAKQEDMSLFMVLLTAYLIVLHRLTQQEDLIVGTPIAGRMNRSLEEVLGFFANTLAIRVKLAGNQTVKELLQAVKAQCLGVYEHQAYPFDVLIEKLNPERSLSQSPVFSTMLSYHEFNMVKESNGLQIMPVSENIPVASKFDLTVNVQEKQDALQLELDYNKDLFRRETAGRFLEMLALACERLADPGGVVGSLDILPSSDRLLLERANDTSVQTEAGTINERFSLIARKYPERIALSMNETVLTYAELDAKSNQVANVLLERGLRKGDFVAILLHRSPEFVISLLGAIKAGGAYVPIDPDYPAERIGYMVADSQSAFLLTESANAELLERVAATEDSSTNKQLNKNVVYVDQIEDHANTGKPQGDVCGTDLAYMIYTSGSTGRPKGTMITHQGVMNLTHWLVEQFGFCDRDTVLQFASFSFDASVVEWISALLSGGRLHLLSSSERLSVQEFAAAVERSQATCAMFLPPVFFKQIADLLDDGDASKLASLRYVTVGGDMVLAETIRAWQRRFGTRIRLGNGYGPTECTVVTCYCDIPDLIGEQASFIPIGSPLPNYQAHVLNEQLQPCPVGVPGELYVDTVGIAKGYWNQPEKTAEAFIPNPFAKTPGVKLYKTGDIVKWLPNGQLVCLGRKDSQIKVRGFRIELSEIENRLQQLEGIEQSAVTVRKSGEGESRLFAFYTCAAENLLSEEFVRAYLKRTLPIFMIPHVIALLNEMPLLPNGKINRKALDLVEISPQTESYQAPRNETENRLARIWEMCLKHEPVGIHDNFFAIGGDSIVSLQVTARCIQAGLPLRTHDIFRHQTVGELAGILDERLVEAAALAASAGNALSAEQDLASAPFSWPQAPAHTLGPVQEWIFTQPDFNKDFYFFPLNIRIEKALDPHKMAKAIRMLAARHEMLRANVVIEEGLPKWHVYPIGTEPDVHIVDISNFGEKEQEAELSRLELSLKREIALARGLLFKGAVVQLSDQSYQIMLLVHHFVFDAVSQRIAAADLIEFYEKLARGEQPDVQPAGASFLQWLSIARAFINSPHGEEALNYWGQMVERMRSSKGISFIEAGGDERDKLQNYRNFTAVIDEAATARLLKASGGDGKLETKHILLSSAVRAVAAWTGRNQVLINCEGHGRNLLHEDYYADLSRTVGWFTSMYPFAFKVRREQSAYANAVMVRDALSKSRKAARPSACFAAGATMMQVSGF
ncbi:non-ribosomal peptide synthetase, partial [Gorillibacterium massiliense]|uniref:non-ribosomal peptide synthetase n=1 Tax=Gorillibacterium massiliense TaxID=1280390 RepID=UPI0006942552